MQASQENAVVENTTILPFLEPRKTSNSGKLGSTRKLLVRHGSCGARNHETNGRIFAQATHNAQTSTWTPSGRAVFMSMLKSLFIVLHKSRLHTVEAYKYAVYRKWRKGGWAQGYKGFFHLPGLRSKVVQYYMCAQIS